LMLFSFSCERGWWVGVSGSMRQPQALGQQDGMVALLVVYDFVPLYKLQTWWLFGMV
jgi:hypothetical protein